MITSVRFRGEKSLAALALLCQSQDFFVVVP